MPAHRIIEVMMFHHSKQHVLCARLEAIADGLPNNVDRQECLVLARDIYPAVKEAHEFEETELFSQLQDYARGGPLVEGLERLRFEHWEDEAYAEEISDALGRIGRGDSLSDAEKISWMLRGFFDGVRRHIAFKSEHLLPILESLTNPERVH